MESYFSARRQSRFLKAISRGVFIFFVWGLCSVSNILQAQSFTYFKYQVPGEQNETYEGLLSILMDGTAVARVKNTSATLDKPVVFELSLTDSFTQRSKNIRFLVDAGITDVTNLSEATLPHHPVFEFEGTQTKEGIYFSLSKIYARKETDWNEVSNLQKQEYSYTDISNDLVDDFYSTDDPFYEEYFSQPRVPDMAGRGGLSSTDRKRKMHLIIVADLEDVTMGEACLRDQENMVNTFSNMVKEMKMIPNTPSITYLTNSKFNKKSVLNALNALKPAKNDIVIFYYTGHGYRDSGDKRSELPKMILGHNYQTLKQLQEISLSMQDVVDIINKKSGAFNLVINDCCNVEMPAPSERPDGKEGLTTSKSIPASIYPKNFEQLFLKPKGTLVFSSASPKQFSVGNPMLGGFFTWHFRVALGKYLSSAKNNVTWDNIFLESAKNANWQAKSGLCPKDSDVRCVQVPQKFSYLK